VTRASPTEPVTPNQLLVLAVEAKADPAQLEKLMELQFRWEANQAKKAYVEAMSKFRSQCPEIDKGKQVDFTTSKGRTNYKYPGLSESINAIKMLLSECGLSHSWKTRQTEAAIHVTCIVTHILGHSEETTLSAPSDTTGNKNMIQAIGSTVSYLERYTLFALLGLAPKDMDNDGGNGNGDNTAKTQKQLIETLIDDAWKLYAVRHQAVLSPGFSVDPAKFKNELRAQYKTLPENERNLFRWTKEHVEKLAGQINVNTVITKEGRNGTRTEGQ